MTWILAADSRRQESFSWNLKNKSKHNFHLSISKVRQQLQHNFKWRFFSPKINTSVEFYANWPTVLSLRLRICIKFCCILFKICNLDLLKNIPVSIITLRGRYNVLFYRNYFLYQTQAVWRRNKIIVSVIN